MSKLLTNMNAILKKLDTEKLFGEPGMPRPVSDLYYSYGPLTDKITRSKTAETAIALIAHYHNTAGASGKDRDFHEAFAIAHAQVVTALNYSPNEVTSNGLLSAICLKSYQDAVTLAAKQTIRQLTGALTKMPPRFIEVLDALLLFGLVTIPYVGPAVAGFVSGGFSGAVVAGVTSGVVYAGNANERWMTGDWTADPKAGGKMVVGNLKDAEAMALKASPGLQDTDKSIYSKMQKSAKNKIVPAKTFGIGLLWYIMGRLKMNHTNSQMKEISKDPDKIMESKWMGCIMNFAANVPINPQTRNQLGVPNVARLINASKYESHALAIQQRLSTTSDSLASLADTLINLQSSIHELMIDIIQANVVESFAEDMNHYKQACEAPIYDPATKSFVKFKFKYPKYVITDDRSGPNSNHTRVIAALIIAYFYDRSVKNENNFLHEKIVDKNRQKSNLQILEEKGDRGDKTVVESFRKLQKQHGHLQPDSINTTWNIIAQNSVHYVKLVKNAIASDMGKPFVKADANSIEILDAVKLFMICTMYLNETISRISRKKNGDADIDSRTWANARREMVRMLRDLGFVNTYSTNFGTVNDDEKKELTKNSQLRAYDGFLRGKASDSEQMMLYMFSCIVVSLVDLTKIACGLQDWAETRKMLHKCIDEINRAEAEM